MAKVGHSVRKAIDDWELADLDSAMLHACNAADGTAAKLYPKLGSNARFTRLLRESYSILEPMAAPGVDLVNTRWPVNLQNPKAPGGGVDFADVIYGIHRCSHGHGEELPEGYELLSDAGGPDRVTRMFVKRGKIRLSDRVIFGLLGVAVLSPANHDQHVPDTHYLTFAGTKLPINEWWGRAADFPQLAKKETLPKVTLDFGDWMDELANGAEP